MSVYFFVLSLGLFFMQAESKLNPFLMASPNMINLAISKNIKNAWTLGDISKDTVGTLVENEQFDFVLPENIDDTHMLLFYIAPKNSEDSLKTQIRLFLTKENQKNSYLISRWIAKIAANGSLQYAFDLLIGRITIKIDKDLISSLISKDGTFSFQENEYNTSDLLEFDLEKNRAVEISKENSGTFAVNRIKELKLGHAYPALVSGITLFAGINSMGKVKNCTQGSIEAISKANQCDQVICKYYGFSKDGVAQQLAFEKKDHNVASVGCQLNVAVAGYQGQGTNKTNLLNALSGQDPVATTTPSGAIYRVPAKDCSIETQNRACFNKTMTELPDVKNRQEYNLSAGGISFPVVKNCKNSTKAKFVCWCKEGEKCIKEEPTDVYGFETKIGPANITRASQEKQCNFWREEDAAKIRGPQYAACLNQSVLKIANPLSCELLSKFEVSCKLNNYDLPPFTVAVAGCNQASLNEACTELATPVSGSCKVK